MRFPYYASGVVAVLAIVLFTSAAHAVNQTWTLDPVHSTLTISAIVDGGASTTPQVAGSDVGHYGGTFVADRVGSTFSFNGGETIYAVLHPSAPFQPTGPSTAGRADNYGFFLPINGGSFAANVRDLVFDITGGSATINAPGAESIRPTVGQLNYAADNGNTNLNLNLLPAAGNTRTTDVTLAAVGGQEMLKLPLSLNYTFPVSGFATAHIVSSTLFGEWVATRGVIGDYNYNGSVGVEDFAIWRNSYGSTVNRAADGNQDGTVNAADYTVWRNRLAGLPGNGAAIELASGNVVPEPVGVMPFISCIILFVAASHRFSRS